MARCLVIGNSAYVHAGQLANPANDAADIAAKLKELGFEVIYRADADKPSMESAITEFAEKLRGAEAGLFYYAGHGIQVNDENYLIPTSAEIKSDVALEWRLIPLGMILNTMANETGGTSIIVLDACRNNPFARSIRTGTRALPGVAGLARVGVANGTLISFSTAPNSVAVDGVGRNSPFAEALLRHISEPGEDIHSILMRVRQDVKNVTGNRQVPWSEDSLTSKFYFVPPPETPSQRRRDTEKELEVEFWNSVKERNDPELLEAYLKRYPQGFHSLLAQALINQIKQQREAQKATQEEEKRRRDQVAKGAQTAARIALLIGNQNYAPKVGPLKNPLHDVDLIGDALKKLGFKVTKLADASKAQMDEAFRRYVDQVRHAGRNAISFFYYSGHGVVNPDNNVNYLIPADLDEADTDKVWYRSIEQQGLIDLLSQRAQNATHFLVFDACRNELTLSNKTGKGARRRERLRARQ